MALSMGIWGYTAWVNSDGGGFWHLDRSGTVSMAAPIQANPKDGAGPYFAIEDMPAMSIDSASLPNQGEPSVWHSVGGRESHSQAASIVQTGAFHR